jgi:hypothetical protein
VGLTGIYLALAAVAAFGLWRTLSAQTRSRRYLAEATEGALETAHLSTALARVLDDAHAVRMALEGPLRQLEAARLGGALETDLDGKLLDASRALGEWLHAVERLGDADADRVAAHAPSAARVRARFERERWSLDRHGRRGKDPLRVVIAEVVHELRAFEEALQRAVGPYR